MDGRKFTTLVLGGGGSKGIAFLGSLDYFYRKELLDLKRISGTSIGSVIGILLGMGTTPSEIFEVVKTVDSPLEGRPDYRDLIHKYGVWSLTKSLAPFIALIVKRFGKFPTFREYFDQTGIHLKICAANINSLEAVYFDHLTHPEIGVIDAMRASCCIPGVFKAVKIKGDYYVDGGFVDNLPFHVWNDVPEEEILALSASGVPPRQEISGAVSYALRIAHLAIISRVRNTIKVKGKSTIVDTFLDDVPLLMSFSVQEKERIFRIGQMDAQTQLSKKVFVLDY